MNESANPVINETPSSTNKAIKKLYEVDSLFLTNRTIRIEGTTYALSHVVSVSVQHIKPDYTVKVLIYGGIAAVLGIFPVLLVGTLMRGWTATAGFVELIVWGISIALGVSLAILTTRPIHALHLSFSSGENTNMYFDEPNHPRRLNFIVTKAISELE